MSCDNATDVDAGSDVEQANAMDSGSVVEQGAGDAGGSASAPASNVELTVNVSNGESGRCTECSMVYDGQGRAPMTAVDCGHTRCGSCWQQRGSTCCNGTVELQHSYPLAPRDLLSPPVLDPPPNSFGAAGTTGSDGGKMQTQAQATQQTVQQAAASAAGGVTATLPRPTVTVAASTPAPSGLSDEVMINIVHDDGRKRTQLRVKLTASVANLKSKIWEEIGLAEKRLRLMHLGKVMEDDKRTLKSYRVASGSSIIAANSCAAVYGG